MKKVVLLTLLCCVVSSTFAQRKTTTEDWGQDPASEIYIPACALPGKITYSYIIGEEGDVLKDGPLSIKCSVVNEKTYISPYTITVNGSYALNATYSKGNLNGPFSSNYKTTLDGYIIVSKDAVSVSSTMTGNFSNGVPNGTFKVTRRGEHPTSLTANFKNGKLVGAFSCSMIDEDMYDQKYSGAFTQDGKFTGAWKMLDGYTGNGEISYEFANGVLISEVRKNKATKPAVSAIARKYASGTLTEEQLYEQGYLVETRTVKLGDFVRIAILRDAAVNFEKLGGYNFSEPNHMEYKWIREIATLTDAGLEELVRGIRAYLIEENDSVLSNMLYSSVYQHGIKYGCISTDDNGQPYIEMHRDQNQGYAKGGFTDYTENVYLSAKQMEYVEQQAYQAILSTVCSLQDVAVAYYNDTYSDDKARFCEDYFKNGKTPADFKTAKELEEAKDILSKVYERCVEDRTSTLPADPNITIISYGDHKTKYVRTESIAEYKKIIDELEVAFKEVAVKNAVSLKEYFIDYYEGRSPKIARYLKDGDVSELHRDNIRDIKEEMTNDYEGLKRLITECPFAESLVSYKSTYIKKDSFAEYKKVVDEFEVHVKQASSSKLVVAVLDYMVAERTAFNICYGESENYYYSTSGKEYWRLELESALKKFGRQFVGYEIISIGDNTVECKLTFLDKKKVAGTWQITLEHKDGKFCVESFDITKATKLE